MERTQQNHDHGRSAEDLLAQMTNYKEILYLAEELGVDRIVIRANNSNL